MTLITLLIVLTIERISATGPLWQFDFYYQKLKSLMLNHLGRPQWLESQIGRWVWILLPVLVIAFLSNALDWLLFEFVFDVLVLLICIGCVKKRKLYKSFLNAANRGDDEACELYAAQLRGLEVAQPQEEETNSAAVVNEDEQVVKVEDDQTAEVEQSEPVATEPAGTKPLDSEQAPSENSSLGQTLVWFNFRYYCAVLFWFVSLGPAGAVLYCMVRERADDSDHSISELFTDNQLDKVLHILDWLPARVCTAGYLLIGHFTKSAGIWLSYLLDFTSSARDLVSKIAIAAESIDAVDCSNTTEPACMLKLAKRNILFFLAMVALLTLYGGIK
ncbi:MAG: regulatory signaling modulator protein AmpE [Psychrosphaera sp.]|nr:regulatory signaling modulator protein AmpE [Psychrosphaera sp.]